MTRRQATISPDGTITPASAHLHGSVSRLLGVAIIRGDYQPGHVFPNEDKFSVDLGVGRSVYREAVRFLAAKGLVESRSKMGTRVLPRDRWNFLDPDVLAWFFEAQPTEKFIRNLLEMRLIIEPAAAELAARHRQIGHLERMRTILTELRVAPFDSDLGLDAGSRFHREVLSATGNEVLASLSSSIDAAVRWTLTFMKRRDAQIDNPFDDHARLFAAIASQDTAAARDVMRTIVVRAYHESVGKETI